MIYLVLLLAVVVVNLLPAFAPPTWTLLVFFFAKNHLNIQLTVLVGVVGATLGRYILSLYIKWASSKVFNKKQEHNLEFLGQKLGKTKIHNFLATFLYSLTPLSSTALFVAAGIAKLRIFYVLVGFFFGRLISYFVLITSTDMLIEGSKSLTDGIFSVKNIISILLAALVLLLFIFIDWITLFQESKLRLNFRVWKWNKSQE